MQRYLCPCTANAGHAAFSGELLPYFAACCSVLQRVAVCCSMLQCIAALLCQASYCRVMQCVAVCCSVLQRVAVCCSVLQCVAAAPCQESYCPVLHSVTECCSVLHCVAVCCRSSLYGEFLFPLFSVKEPLSHTKQPHTHIHVVQSNKDSLVRKSSIHANIVASTYMTLWGGFG